MPPFIRFTENNGQREVFVNAEHVVSATYFSQSGDLQLVMIVESEKARYTLHGQEAADALKILRKL